MQQERLKTTPKPFGGIPPTEYHEHAMGSIRDIKSDIQVFEIHGDLASKFSEQDVAGGVLNIIKTKHHHADGSPVNLHIVQAPSAPPQFDDGAFRTHIQENEQRPAAPSEPRSPRGGIESLAAQANTGPGRPPQPETKSSGSYESGNAANVSGFSVQCNCGMEFTGTSHGKHEDIMITASKYQAMKDEAKGIEQYRGVDDDAEEWLAGAYQSGDAGDSGSYHSGTDYH